MLKFKSMFLLLSLPVFLLSGFALATDSTSSTSKTDTTSQYVSDSAITAKVKSDFLLDSDIKSLSISVATTHGQVTLTGNVANDMQRQKAVKITQAVSGVKSVKDKLIIKTK